MRRSHHVVALAAYLALALPQFGIAIASGSDKAVDVVGVWEAERHFGPKLRGEMTLTRERNSWRAEIAGYATESALGNPRIELEFPGQRGRFVGRLEPHGKVFGHWIQPPMVTKGMAVASPVTLIPIGTDTLVGEVRPLDDVFTFFLATSRRDDGTIDAFLRNPQRNQGIFINVERIERQDDRIDLVGTFFRNSDEHVLLEGTIYPEEPRISIDIDGWGGSYDFRPIGEDTASSFYARAKDPEPWIYRRPKQLQDGWAVGSLAEVGIAIEPIKRLIETEIYPPADDIQDLYLHAMLIARHGKLVLEEYFHGYHRDLPHDTRSASKSLTATLVGAAIEAGLPISESTPVYATVYGPDAAADIEPRKQQMTVEHLLTMSSGFDCDDADSSTPGNEDRMQEQSKNLDWYDYTLNLPMTRDPGKQAVYCSINPNLVGDVLAEATGRSLPELFQQLIAEPLDIERYYLVLQPTGEPYMGGGIHWLPRDFMKLGQLHLDDGVWNGKRILSRAWVDRATSPLYELRERSYGYLWWVEDLPYKKRTVRVFYAGGNGGQVVMGVPELDLVVTFFGGNYNSKTLYRAQREFVPDFILPAVDDN